MTYGNATAYLSADKQRKLSYFLGIINTRIAREVHTYATTLVGTKLMIDDSMKKINGQNQINYALRRFLMIDRVYSQDFAKKIGHGRNSSRTNISDTYVGIYFNNNFREIGFVTLFEQFV